MEVLKVEHPKEEAGKVLTEVLGKYADKPILLMVSGGSALAVLDFVKTEVLDGHVTLTVLDERYSSEPTVNNFSQLARTGFFATCLERGVQTISTEVLEGESLSELSLRFATALHTWRENNPEGVVVATMGIGPDGHTAGLFPGDFGVDFNGDAWVVGYSVPKEVNEYPERVTVTNSFLLSQVEEVVVYAVGEEKQVYVQNLQTDNCDKEKVPACVLREMKTVTVITG